MNRIITLAIVVLAAFTLGNTGCNPDDVAIGEELATIEQGYSRDFKLTDHNAIHRLDLNVQLLVRVIERQDMKIMALENLYMRVGTLENHIDEIPELFGSLAQQYEDNQWTIDSTYAGYSLLMRCLRLGTWTTQCRDDAGIYPTHFDPTL